MQSEGFLKQTARKIFENEKNNLHNVMVLFPNRRAIRFFFEYLKEFESSDFNDYGSKELDADGNSLTSELSTPFFVPEIFSIDEMVVSYINDFQKGENLELLYMLYTVYCDVMGTESRETFDEFYFWGNIILNDFDQIDKELVDAKALFRNLEEYKNLEADPSGYLTKEQIELVNRLFNTSFETENSSMRKNFVKIWNCLYEIYERFNALLDANHLAYSGKMYREFAKRLENNEISLSCGKIKVIGFSVLNNVEKKIFRLLKENYDTDFYWDYDEYYFKDETNEAGIFVRENLKLFPQSQDLKDFKFDNISTNDQQINIISSPYETTSLAYISKWLESLPIDVNSSENHGADIKTSDTKLSNVAIILNDESLIPLVIKTLPEKFKDKINITMGYPFNQTWLYNGVLTEMNKLADSGIFNKENVFNSIKSIADNITKNNKEESLWQISALKKVCKSLLGFISSIEKINSSYTDGKEAILSGEIIKNVLKKELSALNLDILSDGIGGVQLMGMLETRALDFEYILMLSANDDNLPKLSKETSFIPYSFRKAYEMMNTDRKAGVFAYYFYRLLHKAKRVDYIYTTVGGENKLKEKSRFIRQIEIEFANLKNVNKQINYKSLTSVKALSADKRQYYFNIDELKFIDNGKATLSPSALNNLIHCQQKFYLNNVRYLREDIEDDEYLAIAFGNVFHNCASIFYKTIAGKKLSSKEIDKIIEQVVNDYISKEENAKEKRVCGDLIHLNMIRKYIKDVYLLDCEEKIKYLCGEKEYSWNLRVGNHTVHLKGRLDRMDYVINKDGSKILRIVDYKTGKLKDRHFKCFEDLMFCNEDSQVRKDGYENIFEILLYCYLVFNNENATMIKPELMYLSQMTERDLAIDYGRGRGKEVFYYDKEMNDEFEKCLVQLLSSLLEKHNKEPYEAVISEDKCKWCEYKLLCSI